jgi:RNA recognition motif. (a.k.a. RRM, RBD, or RNP domain)
MERRKIKGSGRVHGWDGEGERELNMRFFILCMDNDVSREERAEQQENTSPAEEQKRGEEFREEGRYRQGGRMEGAHYPPRRPRVPYPYYPSRWRGGRDYYDYSYRDPRGPRDLPPRDSREMRDPRDYRDRDSRDFRDVPPREFRDSRDPRDSRDMRDLRDLRDPREMADGREYGMAHDGGYRTAPPPLYSPRDMPHPSRYASRRMGPRGYGYEGGTPYPLRPRRPIPLNPQPMNILGVFGVDPNIREDELREWVETHLRNKVQFESVTLIVNRNTGASKGFGFIYFKTIEEATEAKELLNAQFCGRNPVRVDYSITPDVRARAEKGQEDEDRQEPAGG